MAVDLEEIYRRIKIQLPHIANKSQVECEDLIQEAALRAVMSKDKLRHAGVSREIARTTYYDSLRRKISGRNAVQRCARNEDIVLVTENGKIRLEYITDYRDKENDLLDKQIGWEHIFDIFKNLSPDRREVLDLFYFKGMTLPQISKELNTNQGTIKSRLGRALKIFRDKLLELGVKNRVDWEQLNIDTSKVGEV